MKLSALMRRLLKMKRKHKKVKFKSGDIGFSASNTFFSKAIRFFQSWHTQSASRSHTFAFVGKELCVEALSRVKVNHVSKYEGKDVVVYRIPLSKEERESFRINMLQQASKSYGWANILMFGLDAIATKLTSVFGRKKPIFFFTKHAKIFNIPVCSQLVAWGLHKFTSYELKDETGQKVDWRIVSPDYFEDLLKIKHNRARLIFESE